MNHGICHAMTSISGITRGWISVVGALLLSSGLVVHADAPDGLHMRGAQVVGGPVTPVIVNIDVRDLPAAQRWQPGDPVKEIPRRFFPPKDGVPGFYEANPDPLVDLQSRTEMGSNEAFTTPIVNIVGQGYTGVNPPDTVGDIGPNHYIQAINGGGGTAVQVYAKDGSPIGSSFALDSLGSGSCASGYGDPIVLYDRLADRWFLQEFSSSGNYMCIYISQTGDPVAGGWYFYGFQAPSFPDYPHFGVWSDAYYGTANESSAVYAFDRSNMLLGATARPMQRFSLTDLPGYGFQCATPADLDGADGPPAGAPGLIMRHVDEEAHSTFPNNPTTDLLEVYAFTVDFDTPASSSLDQLPDVVITDFNSWMVNYTTFYSVPQPGTSSRLDPIREVVLNRLQYLNFGTHEALVGVLPTNAYTATSGSDVSAALRWFELRRSGGGSWTVHQEGTFATSDTDENRFVGSIAMDQSGNIALGHSYTNVGASSPTFASLRYTGRLESDTAGVMTQTETQQVTGSGTGSGRWGDYANMTVDPEDDCTYWFTSEYQNGGSWATQITSFRFDACGCDIVVDPPTANAAATAPNVITVSWNDNAQPSMTEYLVLRSRFPGGPYALIATVPDSSPGVGNGAGYDFGDTDVSGGIDYYYVVRASDGAACRSAFSNEAWATATGVCTLPPIFDGVGSVSNPQAVDCQLEVDWAAGAHECGSSLVYNVYRSTSPGFTPGPSNLVASCLTATTFVDTGVLSGQTTFYIVRAEDNSGNGSGLCAGGNEDGNLVEASGAATGPDAVYFADDMESGGGNWTHGGSGDTWALSTARAHSGTTSFHATDVASVSDQQLESLEFALPPVPGITFEFWSWQEVEDSSSGCYDGGIVEASTDNGATWTQLPDAAMSTLPYDGPVATGYSNPIGGQDAWCGDPRDWTFTVVDLTAYAGQAVRLRFRLATDSSVSREGWYVDDVRVITPSTCIDASSIFRDGFEGGTTGAWTATLP
jgi:hypothetical protein